MSRTNTPLQALTLLNDENYLEASRALAALVLEKPQPIREMSLRILSREPSETEMSILMREYNRALEYYRMHPSDASTFLARGHFVPEPSLAVPELAAYTIVPACFSTWMRQLRMNDSTEIDATRRYFLGRCTGLSVGAMALSKMLPPVCADERPTERNAIGGLNHFPHFASKAKRVIFLTQSGGPSQLELFDEKPDLMKWAGVELPDSVRQGQRVTTMTANQKQLVMPARVKFARCGSSGATIGEWLPHLQRVADDVCFIKSMHTDEINHAPAMTKFLTGHQLPGRPSMGAWVAMDLVVKIRTCLTTWS